MKAEELGNILVAMSGEERKDLLLWDVLCALRGPDNEDEDIKEATTQVIRWHFLGKNPHMRTFSGSFCAPDSEASMCLRVFLTSKSGAVELAHFRSHALRAFEALGLRWDEVNT